MATPEEMQRALAMYSGYDPLAEQQAALEQQQANDALMGGTGQQPPTMSEPLMSEAPAMAPAVASTASGEPVDPNSVSSVPPEALMSQQLASYADVVPEQPAPPTQAAPAPAPRPAPAQVGGGGSRRPSMLDEQTAELGLAADRANESQSALDASVGNQAALLEQQGANVAGRAQATADTLKQQQADLQRAGETAQLRRDERQRVVDQRAKEYEQLNAQNAQIEIRDRRSTTQKVMGAIAIGLGQMTDQNNLVAGLMQGMNVQTSNASQISEMLSAAVDRDLAIQRANLENKKDNAAAKFSELGIARAAVQDVDDQEAHARAAILDKYATGLESLKQEGIADDAVTTGMLAAEQLRGQAAQLRAQSDQRALEKADDRVFSLQAQKEAQDRAAAAARARANQPMSLKERAEIEGKLLDNEKKRRELDAPSADDATAPPKGREIRDPALAKQATKEQRSKFAETETVTKDLEGKINQLLKLREEHSVAVGVPEMQAYKDAQTLNREIMLGLKKKHELGTLDNQSERFLNEMTRDPNAWFINTPESALELIKESARRDVETRAQSLGYSSALDARDEYAAKYGARER